MEWHVAAAFVVGVAYKMHAWVTTTKCLRPEIGGEEGNHKRPYSMHHDDLRLIEVNVIGF